ncbi:MAG: peptidoglycan DD-metalloendopeptidase family protein [Gammaproteobacteria bacterium]|nr:peptidoglycan DD-metalloendopeptidase family protein [Gammaproteobacteria bacterium]MDH3431660.1 peptidoglycan DD-metalloendopeptidase family protein [Gammaproteobacteria bacterium]
MRIAATVLFLCLGSVAYPQESSWPGGIAFIDLGAADGARPVVEYAGHRVLVLSNGGRWHAVIGVPLDAAIGTAEISAADGAKHAFEIREHAYREQRLQVAKNYVSLSEENLERVGNERKVIDAALTNWRDVSLDGVHLSTPVAGRKSSSFGLRRFFNDEPRSPHKGMDISASEGEPVAAPRGGVITTTGDFYFNGNTVFVDHGQGFVTMYCHLSEITVAEGQVVGEGEIIGLVGATGRATGPHLHFGTYMNGTAVDPALLLAEP